MEFMLNTKRIMGKRISLQDDKCHQFDTINYKILILEYLINVDSLINATRWRGYIEILVSLTDI